MDVGLYRDEQFSFVSSAYMDCYSNDSTSFTIERNELYEDLRPMPQPPNDIFEWHSDATEKELNCDIEMIDQSNECNGDGDVSPDTKEDLHKMLGLHNWQSVWQPPADPSMKQIPISSNYAADEPTNNNKSTADLQDIIERPELSTSLNMNTPQLDLRNIKIENDFCNSKREVRLSKSSPNTLSESSSSYRRESESSDLFNASFNSTELINFDIAEYVFEENKQTKKSIEGSDMQFEPIRIKEEYVLEKYNVDSKPSVVKTNVAPKRTVKAGVKRIDLKAQRYIIERDAKKSISEDECDVDIETIPEEGNSPVLEAGNLNELLEQFEATEVQNKEHIANGKYSSSRQQNVSLNVNVKIKTEKDKDQMKITKPVVKVKVEKKPSETTKPMKIKLEKLDEPYKKVETVLGTNLSETPQINQHKSESILYINNSRVPSRPLVRLQETTTSSKTSSGASSNRQILDSLPQELINRIKESGKRKPITVIQAIPNNRKRNKVQEPFSTVPLVSSETVHLDHNYCGSSSKPNTINKKDSGFASEEDDRAFISRQPTVKNADGTLMVSLLKVNTIHKIDPTKNPKKKLNLEEYKKRHGLLTSNNNSLNCSPSTSACSSPGPEDEQQKMLKHLEKLRKMAQGVLNASPKTSLRLIPLSPSTPNSPMSPAESIDVKKDVLIKTEPENKKITKVELLVKSEIFERMSIKTEPRKVPPNLECKVLVSFGVNTDFRIAKNEDPLAPVEKLEEIKPLLEKASGKINGNSLIASVIENIPKVIDKNEKSDNNSVQGDHRDHGEHKQIIYLEKDRVRCETKDAESQTNISLIEQTKRGRMRRRLSSGSSSSSYKSTRSASSRRSRKSSNSSLSSRSSVTSRSSTSSPRSEYSSRNSSRLSYSRSRSRSPTYNGRRRNSSAEREHMNAVEERRIIYVGKIVTGTTKEDLRRKFHNFGPISKISLHFRDIGENYGFVTFKYKEDAHEAFEHGNDNPSYPWYKISFGGRREFCQAAYSDLDNMRDDSYYLSHGSGDSYDKLLGEALEKLKKRKA